jgi:plastocyanin
MKKNYILLSMILFLSASTFGAQFTVSWAGFTYSPSTINATVGDTINFPGSSLHPLVQVSQTTWNANGATPLAGGWGTKTTNYMHVITVPGNIYYVCQNHVGGGMKGQVVVTLSNVAEMIGDNNVKLLTNSIVYNEATVLNTTGLRGQMEIYDLTGKVVNLTELTGDARQQIPVDLKRGIFLYRFIMEGNKPTPTDRMYVGADLR